LNQASVRFENVSKAYGTVVAVREVSFEVAAGTLVTLLGPSGCGKTTTLRMIAGLELATAGRIYIEGQDVTTLPATARDVAMVFQSYALFPHMTVQENVGYGLSVSGRPKAEIRRRADEAMATVGLAGYGERLPAELSGGQQQRVAVARAIVLEPQVLLFDEPLSNLDTKLRRRVREELRDLQQRLGITSIYVTHDQEEALAVSDRIIVMNQAVIAQAGTPRELYEEPASRFVADFIGDANLLQAEVTAVDGQLARVQLGASSLALPSRGMGRGPATLAIRPHAIRVHDRPADGANPMEVSHAIYLGSHVQYELDGAVGHLFATAPAAERMIPKGDKAWVTFDERSVALVPA
jgi:iron(III) transport system ATP-binding protein